MSYQDRDWKSSSLSSACLLTHTTLGLDLDYAVPFKIHWPTQDRARTPRAVVDVPPLHIIRPAPSGLKRCARQSTHHLVVMHTNAADRAQPICVRVMVWPRLVFVSPIFSPHLHHTNLGSCTGDSHALRSSSTPRVLARISHPQLARLDPSGINKASQGG
jgi:hypothetical protein